MSDFKNILKSAGSSLQLNMSDAPHQPLPPASLQTFMKERPDISGLVITNHEKEFLNRYFPILVQYFSVHTGVVALYLLWESFGVSGKDETHWMIFSG